VFGEVMAVYKGRTLTDSMYQPYLAICEKYGVPVAYHSGGSFPNAQQLGWPKYRIALGDPFLIEDVLVKYPKLKLYLMHAGENFYENTLRMMDGYPNLYAELRGRIMVASFNERLRDKVFKISKRIRIS
jgi:predicted TIM-barrel fold metal-dependent hydrolase